MRHSRVTGPLPVMALAALVAIFTVLADRAFAYTYKVLYSFCAQDNCADGDGPMGSLLLDSTGALYGTAFGGGGPFNRGTVFALVPNGDGYDYRVLHQFCLVDGCPDGAHPRSTLIADVDGNLYGTAGLGGAQGRGSAFELMPNAKRTKWKFKTLYDFCSVDACSDGGGPSGLTYPGAGSGTPYDGTSPLFGSTGSGGTANLGVAFQLNFVQGKTQRREKVLYSFCSQANCADGGNPFPPVVDAMGNLFGTAGYGNGASDGVVFELSAKKRKFRETVLHAFCTLAMCTDGKQPMAPVTLDASGNLYGTTNFGGDGNSGEVFKVVPNGTDSQESVLYSFCLQPGCLDGDQPQSGLLLGAEGDLYGTTAFGGAQFDGGTVFRLHANTLDVLYNFCSAQNCADGRQPSGALIGDASGDLFGMTESGGANGGGTVFALTP